MDSCPMRQTGCGGENINHSKAFYDSIITKSQDATSSVLVMLLWVFWRAASKRRRKSETLKKHDTNISQWLYTLYIYYITNYIYIITIKRPTQLISNRPWDRFIFGFGTVGLLTPWCLRGVSLQPPVSSPPSSWWIARLSGLLSPRSRAKTMWPFWTATTKLSAVVVVFGIGPDVVVRTN